jgi:hypothetical protein
MDGFGAILGGKWHRISGPICNGGTPVRVHRVPEEGAA